MIQSTHKLAVRHNANQLSCSGEFEFVVWERLKRNKFYILGITDI